MRAREIIVEFVQTSTNNLGRPIAPTPEALKSFWNWFGKSKIADRQGRPIVVHHGTTAHFFAFDPQRSNSNTNTGVPHGAFVFSNSTEAAQSYAGQSTKDWGLATDAEEREYKKLLLTDKDIEAAMAFFKAHAVQDVKSYAEGGQVMPVYLKINKPLKVNAKGDRWNDIYFKDEVWTTNELMEYAQDNGYDGLIIRNVRDRQEGHGPPADTYVVFSPTQIKSAIGNKGTFHPEKPEIDEDENGIAKIAEWDKNLPMAGSVVSGLRVRREIDNLGSVGASFEDYSTLRGVREIPFSLFTGPDGMTRRIRYLMEQIEESGEITPLIVAIDSHNGPYILEGAHRYDALQYLNKPTFPALVVFDNDDGYFDEEELNEVEIGGGIDDDDFIDGLHKQDLSGDQLDLFEPNTTTGDPKLPANLKIVGRIGEYYVAKRDEAKKGYQSFVLIFKGQAVSYIMLYPWSRESLNYPHENAFKPDLNGNGLRVGAVYVRPDARGNNLGVKMYQWVLENACDYIIADQMQTRDGVALWKHLQSTRALAVEVWDGNQYISRARRKGKDFNHVYNTSHLVPWVTLRSKLSKVLGHDEEE